MSSINDSSVINDSSLITETTPVQYSFPTFETYADFEKHMYATYSLDDQYIIEDFMMYLLNKFIGNRVNDGLYERNKVSDATGELHAFASVGVEIRKKTLPLSKQQVKQAKKEEKEKERENARPRPTTTYTFL